MKSPILLLVLALIACADARVYTQCGYRFRVFTQTAHNRGGLMSTVSAFQRALGDPDNLSNPGPLDKGRREINWDAAAVPFDMPFDFFNSGMTTRGAIFKARRNEFRVSNPVPPPPIDDRFSSLLPRNQARRFVTFSPERLFTPFEDNKVAQFFRVPATNIKASTAGFGAVFTDVDLKKKTYIDFYTKSGCKLWRLFVPPKSKGLSFAGLYLLDGKPWIHRVVIKLGTISVKQAGRGGKGDVVVLDDFLYGEPMAA